MYNNNSRTQKPTNRPATTKKSTKTSKKALPEKEQNSIGSASITRSKGVSKKKISKSKPKTQPNPRAETGRSEREEEKSYETNHLSEFTEHIISEKRTKDSLKRLITTSSDLLTQQTDLLNQCEEMAHKISASDYEIDRMNIKQQAETFPKVLNSYTENLENILEKLRKSTKDIENAKQLKEENKSLKYKIEMLSIDKSDDYLNIESQMHSMRSIYANEINSMINFFNEIGLGESPMQKINAGNITEDKIVNFFALIKKHIKSLKLTILSQEERIKFLSNENAKISSEAEKSKKDNESLLKRRSELNEMNTTNFASGSNEYNFNYSNMNLTNNNNITNSNINESYIDNYKRSKDLRASSNDPNNELSLDHKYNDSYFYAGLGATKPVVNTSTSYNPMGREMNCGNFSNNYNQMNYPNMASQNNFNNTSNNFINNYTNNVNASMKIPIENIQNEQ